MPMEPVSTGRNGWRPGQRCTRPCVTLPGRGTQTGTPLHHWVSTFLIYQLKQRANPAAEGITRREMRSVIAKYRRIHKRASRQRIVVANRPRVAEFVALATALRHAVR